jgi:hypothetical protein
MVKIADVADTLTQCFGVGMDWIADVWHEVTPDGTTTIETVPDGEAQNLRAFLQTHDLLSLPPGALVTAFVDVGQD